MTVKELKEKLESFPDDMPIYIAERASEYNYGLLNSAYTHEIHIITEVEGWSEKETTVVVLDEE